MVSHYTKLRVRRSLRRKQQTLGVVGTQANQQFDKLVLGRWRNLHGVQRFVIGWLALVVLLMAGVFIQNRQLSAQYQTTVPAAGGSFREAVVGNLTNMNPIFATGPADQAAAKLMFSSLLKYDTNGRLVGDLASNWRSNKQGTVYTVRLKPNLLWHDGEPLTAKDVAFTYNAIQHPDTRSYLNSSWRGVQVQAKGDRVVVFKLPGPFVPFPHALTVGGIIPEHILGKVDPSQLRSHTFNVTAPVGSGPFLYENTFEVSGQKQVQLLAYEQYHFGAPKLDHFVLQTYADHEQMISAFRGGELSGMGGVRTIDRETMGEDIRATWYDLPLNSVLYAFFNNTDPLLKDVGLREALVRATDNRELVSALGDRFIVADGPLLKDQPGYNERARQYGHSPKAARQALNKAGWKLKNGVRQKGKRQLALTMVTQNSDDYPLVAEMLQRQWARVGVKLKVNLVGESEIQQNHILPHNYQILLFGITIGRDPDVFPYWHSSQRGAGGFNLSKFSSPVSDLALEAGRTRMQPRLRAAKYRTFMLDWRNKVPAVALYQPGYGYVQHGRVSGFVPMRPTMPDERFNYVHNWQINTKRADRVY